VSIEIIIKARPDDETAALLVRILGKLVAIEEMLMTEKEVVEALGAEVANYGTVVESAMALIDGLVAAINSTTDVSPEVQAILDTVVAQREALAQKVVENTAAATPPA
jgi:DNA-binding FrmR family transcriptional regulator